MQAVGAAATFLHASLPLQCMSVKATHVDARSNGGVLGPAEHAIQQPCTWGGGGGLSVANSLAVQLGGGALAVG